jgi:hypothetical protein
MKMTMANSLTIVSKLGARAPIYVALLASLAFMLGIGGTAQAKFNASQVGPNYGCLVNIEALESQTMQLNSGKDGHFTSGSMSLNIEGEACFYTLTSGSYTIDTDDGTGTIVLTWTFTKDADGDDSAVCALAFGTSFTDHFAYVLESSGKQLDLVSADPTFTGAQFTTTDQGDFVLSGSCHKQ